MRQSMQQSSALGKPAILKQYPSKVYNNTTVNQLGNGEAPIEVFPSEVFFKDIEAQQNYEVTVTIRNITKKMRRVKITTPKTNKFKCDFEQTGSIAAGLFTKVNIQFETSEEGDFEDFVDISTEGYPETYRLHLHAYKSSADVQFEPLVNLKYIPIGKERTELVEFKNEGRVSGYVNLIEDPKTKTGVICEPSAFRIGPDEVVKVRMGLTADTPEVISKTVKVQIDGNDAKARTIEVTGTCVEQHLSIVFAEGGGQKSALNFGTLYMGERRQYPAFLVNNGPTPSTFKVKFLQGLRNLDENINDEGDNFISPADVGKAMTDRVLTVEPLNGVVGPYQQIPLTFVCRTSKREQAGGFTDFTEGNGTLQDQSKFTPKPQDYASLAVLTFENNALGVKSPDLKVQMMARSTFPDIKINRQTFSFGECPTNDRRDLVLQIKNRNEDLAIDFCFNKVAQFRAMPAKGKLLPNSEHTINISFEPKNFGSFKNKFNLEVLGGVYQIPLYLEGQSNQTFEKTKGNRGPHALVADFDPKLKPTTEEEAVGSLRQKILNKRVPKGDSALAKMSDDDVEAYHDNVQQYLITKANKARFNNFVKHERINREIDTRIAQKMKETNRAPPQTLEEIKQDIDLGMNSLEVEPKFEFTKEVDPLYVEKPIGKYEPSSTNLERMRAKKESHNADRILRKKFKLEPTTQAELRDCQTELTGEQLQKIQAGPTKINYKNVFVKSSTTKSFNVSNDLRQHIYVRLMVDQYPELRNSSPLSQVIPPGQEAGFDIVFCSDLVKTFSAPVTYYINDRPFNFLVQAQADPVSLQLSKKVLKFQFNDENTDMSVIQQITVTNYGNASAFFTWQHPSNVFIPSPLSDEVPPGKSKQVQITFNPPGPKVDDEILLLKIKDGANEELRCQGSVTESRCVFIEKQLDFGNVHVGLKAKDQTIHIKNQLRTTAIFHVISSHPELTIYPSKGRISSDQKLALTIGFQTVTSEERNIHESAPWAQPKVRQPNREKDYATEIIVNIRGGKQLRIPVTAKSVIPDLYIEEKKIDFGKVTYGDQKVMPVTIFNRSNITAKLILDIRDYPEFEIIMPDPCADDDIHSEIMVPIHEHPKYDDILNQNPEDVVDPLGEEEEEEDDDAQDEDSKRHVQISIRPSERPFELKLKYTPQAVEDPKNFELPLTLAAFGKHKMLERRVTAVGEKPRFFLEPTVVNFKTKVIAKGQKPVPFTLPITISNPDLKPTKWHIDKGPLEDSKVFSLTPMEGTLDPDSQSQVRVTFNPHEPIAYEAKIPLYLDDNSTEPYLTIELKGEGTDAKIFFDRREVILPPVPLDTESKASFMVCHNGYENLELEYKIANEVGKLPITISFPDGKNLGVTKSKVKVDAVFKFSTPLSFTTFVDFFDDEGNKFSIPISGTTDNSMFSVFTFLQRNFEEGILLRAEAGKPIKLELENNQNSDSDSHTGFGGNFRPGMSKGGGASSVLSRTARSLVGYAPVKYDLLERNCEYITRWFNSTMSTSTLQSFPQDLLTQNGAQIFELITYLSGKKAPGQATAKQLSAANHSNAKDALKVLLTQYEELINFLKVNGAHLNTVRPEYLLHISDYNKFLKVFPKEENMKPKTVERIHPYVSMESWITIFYQVLRIYYLNRITAKNFKNLPGVNPTDAIVEPFMTKSNIYSVSETILLKWLAYHYNQMNPTHPRVLANFDTDLQDSLIFAALIRSHYGEAAALKDFRQIVSDQAQLNTNARRICEAIKEIGISSHIEYRDIAEPSARELLLFCVQLYQTLPHYIPKATIEFPAVLGDLVTKNIELSNPSKLPISYWVKLVGSSDFSIETDQVRIEPGETLAFPVKFLSRISKLVKGKVIFTNKKEGNVQAAAMVFELKSNVYDRLSVDTIAKTTKLYKALQIDLGVDNGFNKEVNFQITIQYERANPKAATKGAKDKKAEKPAPKAAQNAPAAKKNEAVNNAVPEPFFCKSDHIKIRAGQNQTVPILFLPFELGIHTCKVIFTDENVGEVQYTIIGKAELPEILDTFTGDCNSEEPFIFKKILNFRNDKLEQARNQISEKEKKENKNKRQNGTGVEEPEAKVKKVIKEQSDQKLFEIEISNPFFSGPGQMTLYDQTAVKSNMPTKGKDGKAGPMEGTGAVGQNIFELNCNPTKPASYTCYVILKSLDRTDIRLYEYKLTAIPQKIKAQLEFRVPARGIVTQDIPIVNNSSQEWKVIASMDKAQYFSINKYQLLVKKGQTENFSLTFKPTWVCKTSGTLTLRNESTREEYEYELKGIGEEPLAEDHIILNCNARETHKHPFSIKNPLDKEVSYTVWTDLQNAVGKKEFVIPPKETYTYDLAVTPLLGGVYTASITFQDDEEKFLWWTVEVRTDSPKPEAVIDLRAFIRKATSAEISLSNPLNEPITFEVFYQGEGLIGDSIFCLEPKSIGTFNLIFSPLSAGEFMGNIGFLNEKVGEFWYDLNLVAEENPVVMLELLECELGKNADHFIELENPTGKEIFLDYRNSNPVNFEVIPDKVILPAFDSVRLQIRYSPSNLDVVESGTIVFDNPLVGKWEYCLEGKGLVPTIMEPHPISTAVGSNTSSMLSFRNPFKEQAQVQVHMEGEDSKIFQLLLKRNQFKIGPLGTLQIPYSFSPVTMTESKAIIVVSMSKTLVWKYPLRGIAESASSQIDYFFRTRARKPYEERLKIFLPGFQSSDTEDFFHHEINVQNDAHKKLVTRSVFLDQRTQSVQSADEPIEFDLRFEPLRPFKTQCEIIIYKSTGGRWKFNVVFEAQEPEMDDVIVIQSPLHKTSSVSFKLTNHLKSTAEFSAFFTSESASEFLVHPKRGILEPYGKDGTNFIVSFTPTEYGQAKIARLIIQTDEMQWTYEIRGSHPQYKIPTVDGSRVQNKLSKDVQSKLQGSPKKNFLKENQRATRQSPEKSGFAGSKMQGGSPSRVNHASVKHARDNSTAK